MTIIKIDTMQFLSQYKLFENDAIQQVQLQHRLDLVHSFEIEPGMRVLEIGCGQGDTTAALAHAVGDHGFITAIDIASPDYGAPFTLGQATERIKHSSLGKRIAFHFETDFLTFEPDAGFVYDAVVFFHCSWYFKNPNDLKDYFHKINRLAKRICFAEWDLDFTSLNQRAHFCASSILALHSNLVDDNGNIQSLFHKQHIEAFLNEVGFEVTRRIVVNATYLQDGSWEQDYANSIREDFFQAPPLLQVLVTSYYDLMNKDTGVQHSLNSFVVCAESKRE